MCAKSFNETWSYIDRDVLSIIIDNGIPSTTKYLRAFSLGGQFSTNPIKIVVCGFERISLVSLTTKLYQEFVGSNPISLDVSKLFMNTDDSNCPIRTYKVASESGLPLVGDNAEMISLSGTMLSIKYL